MAFSGDVDESFDLWRVHFFVVVLVYFGRGAHDTKIEDGGPEGEDRSFVEVLLRRFFPLHESVELFRRQVHILVLRGLQSSFFDALKIALNLQQIRIDNFNSGFFLFQPHKDMRQPNFIVLAAGSLEEGVGGDGAEDDVGDFCGIKIDIFQQSVIVLFFEGQQRVL